MVLFSTFNSINSRLCKGPLKDNIRVEIFNILTLGKLFSNLCKACQEKAMASFPPSAFSAGRIRETQKDIKITNIKKSGEESSKYFNTTFMELSPVKYNSKLMNSIWGFYNRYSPHNVKKINDANPFHGELKQSAANSSVKNEAKITLPSAKLENMWSAINMSQ